MEFKFKLEGIVFYVELREDPDFKPQKKAPLNTDYTLDDLKNGEFIFYSLFIISKKEDQSLKHYTGGLVLTSKKEEISKELEEMTEQASELNTKPKMRRSFNLFRRRPVSMSAADRDTDKGEEKVFKRDDPIRHSYHAGDLPVPDPSNLRKCFDLRSEPLIYETGGILCKPKE